MYTGNPHQDRNHWKPFTGGFQQGWGDRRPPAIPLPIDVKDRGGIPAIPLPNPFSGGFQQGWGSLGPLANYSTDKRIYNDWMIKDLLNQGSIGPGEVIDIGKPGYKQVVPKLMGQQLASNSYYSHPNFGRGNKRYDGTFRQEGYGDPNAKDLWGQDWDYRDDDYDINVLDPGFTNFGPGPLYFG